MAMKIGPFLLFTMPGEPMVEYGFKLEKAIADRATPFIVGYANGNIGYIATAEAHKSAATSPTAPSSSPKPRP
jgi:neutral ceramidase